MVTKKVTKVSRTFQITKRTTIIIKEELTLEHVHSHFICLVRKTILPFIHNLEALYYSKVDLNQIERKHLEELKEIVLRYLRFEARILERVHNNQLIKYLEEEIIDVKRITRDVQAVKIDGLEKDFEELLFVLEEIHDKLKGLISKAKPKKK